MRAWILSAALTAMAAGPVALAPVVAQASCEDTRTTGTILGGVGGALIGNSLARGGGGLILGGVGGALAGRAIAGSTCRHSRAYYRARYYGPPGPPGPPPAPAAPVYYDQFGNVAGPGAPASAAYSYAQGPACRIETQSYYDQQGALVRVRVCAR